MAAQARFMNSPATGSLKESTAREGARKRSRTAGYFAAFIALGIVTAALGPTLPALAQHTGVSMREIGSIFTSQSLGYLIGSMVGGRLFDRVKGNPVMAAVLIAMALMAALLPVVPSLLLLAAVVLILGAAEGVLDVGGNTLMVWVHGRKVGPFMNALHFFFGVGAFISPIIVAQALVIGAGITSAYWAMALLILPLALWLFRVPSPDAPVLAEEISAGRVNNLLVVLIAAFLFLYVGAEVGFSGWIYTYAVALDLSDETASAYLTSAFWGALTVGRLLGIPMAARFRPSLILLGDLGGCLASVLILLLWPWSLTAVWIGAIGLGLSMASVFPATLAFAERHMTITARTTSWFIVGASAGCMSLPWLIGRLFESAGPRILMIIMLADMLAVAIIFGAMIIHSTRTSVGKSESHEAA
jgi:FHS family Na+ dependent glucose MFS transporter 1